MKNRILTLLLAVLILAASTGTALAYEYSPTRDDDIRLVRAAMKAEQVLAAQDRAAGVNVPFRVLVASPQHAPVRYTTRAYYIGSRSTGELMYILPEYASSEREDPATLRYWTMITIPQVGVDTTTYSHAYPTYAALVFDPGCRARAVEPTILTTSAKFPYTAALAASLEEIARQTENHEE